MNDANEKIPGQKEIEKEIGDFLSKKFGGSVKIISPVTFPKENKTEKIESTPKKKKKINFNLLPEELVSYLDQYIVKQDKAKTILATKICTHFNRLKACRESGYDPNEMVGRIKNNVLMIGPTGVGKTYMIKLIAKKIGVPFVKGDATKFSETGYVGGDVEDLIRDLVRESDDDIEKAQYGIVYLDEIDKIASSRNTIGADISRTGVQRALLKPMEETEIDLKVSHDPISIIQEIEQFRKTGKKEKRTINTKHILFIMSGAFNELPQIIRKRMTKQSIGFRADISSSREEDDILKYVQSEDLMEYGFESEFIGRLPVRAVFEKLMADDLCEILKNPSNPIILGKKLDFAAYGINIKFDDDVLCTLAAHAYTENTGARGLVSAVENALLLFETKLPSTNIKKFPATGKIIEAPQKFLKKMIESSENCGLHDTYENLLNAEKDFIKAYVTSNKKNFSEKYNISLTSSFISVVAAYYSEHIMDIESVINKIKSFHDEVKKKEASFLTVHDIHIIFEDEAVDYIIKKFIKSPLEYENFYKQLLSDFEYGLKLIRDKTKKKQFLITKEALTDPGAYISKTLKNELLEQITDNPF